jgi:glyoxylate/hydroxypyruvate reductase A
MPRTLGVYLSTELDLDFHYGATFARLAPELELRYPDAIEDPSSARFAIAWLPAEDAFRPYPNLGFVSSIAAGVDGILKCPSLPDIPVIRVRDPEQAQIMAGYVASAVLWWERRFPEHLTNQKARIWDRFSIRQPSGVTVGIVGYGLMGQASALTLRTLGFNVVAQVRSAPAQTIEGVRLETGPGALERVAAQSDYLVNLLPLTAETRGIFSSDVLARMPKGSVFINAGRGGQLDEAALIAAMETGQIKGAALDVFAEEPLPPDHPFWSNPNILLTSHDAAEASAEALVRTIAMQVERLRVGLPVLDPISRDRGY